MHNSTAITGLLLSLGTAAYPALAQTQYASLKPRQVISLVGLASSLPPTSQLALQSLKSELEALKTAHGITFFYIDQVVEDKLLPKSLPVFSTWQEELHYVLTKSHLQYKQIADNTYVISSVLAPAAFVNTTAAPISAVRHL